LHEGIIKVTT
jgi:hypothetical protein